MGGYYRPHTDKDLSVLNIGIEHLQHQFPNDHLLLVGDMNLPGYKTLVRSNLEYACQVWDPYLKKNIKKLEKIQNKSLKFIYRIKSHTSYSKLRQNTNLSSLKNRRKECRAKLFCRALETGVIKNPMEAPSKKHNTRQREMFYLPSITSATYFNSFWPRTMRDLRGV